MNTEDEAVDIKLFNEWWDSDIIINSPYRKDTPAYWAWAGWQVAYKAGASAEREKCAGLRKEVVLQGKHSTEYEDGFWDGLQKYEDLIRARGQA